MANEDTNKQSESEAFLKAFQIDQVLNLQYLAQKRDLTIVTYTREQLSMLDLSDLKMYRSTLHELLYAPPMK